MAKKTFSSKASAYLYKRYIAGAGCGSGRLRGGSGKHRAVVGLLCWNWGCENDWRAIQPEVVAAPGTSHGPRLCL